MPTPRLSPALMQARLDAVAAHANNVKEAWLATAPDIPYRTFQSQLRRAKEDPGILSSMDAVGTNMVPAMVWAKTQEPDENGMTYSVMLKPDAVEDDMIERVRAAVEGIEPAKKVAKPQDTNADLLTIYPIADAHLGLMAWGRETGQDWDTPKARDRLTEWMGQVVDASPNSDTAIVLDVGDLLHADDQSNQTPRSKHALDTDTRHFKTIDVTIQAMGSCIEAARRKHKRVIVRILPGNHNPMSYMAILFALAERYRDTPEVAVQKEPGEFFAYEFGNVMIAAHHGDKAKAQQMVLFLADEYPEMWGRTRHRMLFTGHLHHTRMQDIGGVTHEQLRAVTARDAYSVSHAYASRAQLQGITYHRERGEISRVKVAA